MKNKLSDSLKASLSAERKAVQSKDYDFEDRFKKAESLFKKEEENTHQNTKPTKILNEKPEKVIRDTFSIPERDYKLIEVCKARALLNKYQVNKSELVRAGMILLNNLSDLEFIAALKSVKKIKTGRPKS